MRKTKKISKMWLIIIVMLSTLMMPLIVVGANEEVEQPTINLGENSRYK